MSRKQVVLIERIVLAAVAVILLVCAVRILVGKTARSKLSVQTERQESSTEDILQETDTEPAEENESLPGTETSSGQPDDSVLLSFAGDCTIGSLLEWQGSNPRDFQSVVGTDYAYPLSGVRQIFSADDLTMVNLEGTFTTLSDAVSKPYRFKGDPSYVQVLTEGSVEAVSASNNHSDDFFEAGVQETLETLDLAGIRFARAGQPMILQLKKDFRIGVVSYNTVENWNPESVWREAVKADIDTCKEKDCNLIIGFMHWGTVEYLPEPEDWEVAFAHNMADWGCDLIVGGHAHILQRMEYYHDVPIFYSMGNFCYGGNLNPDDKDSVIVQVEYKMDPEKNIPVRTGIQVIPCLISSRTDTNDYHPVPCEEGTEDYMRILNRLEWTE